MDKYPLVLFEREVNYRKTYHAVTPGVGDG
jgi:hypothetical protein